MSFRFLRYVCKFPFPFSGHYQVEMNGNILEVNLVTIGP